MARLLGATSKGMSLLWTTKKGISSQGVWLLLSCMRETRGCVDGGIQDWKAGQLRDGPAKSFGASYALVVWVHLEKGICEGYVIALMTFI